MAKFKTRESGVVDAVRLTWRTWNEVCELLERHSQALGARPEVDRPVGVYVDAGGNIVEDGNARMGLRVPTPDGAWLAVEGDWILLGPNGELSCCKPALFLALFAPA